MGGPMLERERELAALAAAAAATKTGAGSLVFLAGEAGIGKSMLVDALPAIVPAGVRLLVGYCDDLAAPRVLGPLWDLVGGVGSALSSALGSGDLGQVCDALRAELNAQPTVLVVEDVHWADEATLDVLRFLARRIAKLPAALVLTYRDGDLAGHHPLRQLLGQAASAQRLHPARLSPDAVRRLSAHTGLDVAQVYEVTSGNPFFVVEVLTSGDAGRVPRTVVEAVRSRLLRLAPAAQAAVEQLAVVPSASEQWLVDAVVPGGMAALADAEQCGVLTVTPAKAAFHHELARRAVLDSLPVARRVACNQAVLKALLGHDGVDESRIVHHAAEAGDDQVLIQHGPVAARTAAATGAHREAVVHYRLVLDHLAAFDPHEQVELLQAYVIECYTAGLPEQALPAQEEVVRGRRAQDDPRALGVSLYWLSRLRWWAGDTMAANTSGAEAVAVLQPTGDGHPLALALTHQASLLSFAGRYLEAVPVAERAVAMARALGDAGLLSQALNYLGTCTWWSEGRTHLEESLRVALGAGETEAACRAYVNLTTLLVDVLDLDEAERVVDAGIALATETEFLGFLRYLRLNRCQVHLLRGRWDQAESDAGSLLEAETMARCHALIFLGLIRIRRGEDGGDELLEEAWTIAQQLGEPQRIYPVADALLERAWLRDDLPATASTLSDVYRRFVGSSRAPGIDEFEYWLTAAGLPVERFTSPSDSPYLLLAAGKWREAAALWRRAGCPYESALAVANSADAEALLTALPTVDELRAEPLARRLRHQLRELGVARVPRGRRPATRESPAGLTGRQADVVRLLADGLTNAEIAARLVLSVRTVDTHVAAVLNKLNARTRREAVARAHAIGLLADQP